MTVTGTTAGEQRPNDASPSESRPAGSDGYTDRQEDAIGVLRLRGRAMPDQRVRWEQDVVDNEGLGRKKSKICCIYHKPKAFDESSDESSSDGDDDSDASAGSADSREGARNPRKITRWRRHRHDHGHDHEPHSHEHGPDCASGSGSQHTRQNGYSSTMLERPSTPPLPNAYERNPGKGKDRA
ncbi:Type 1 phosphatases regulator ypi1 [Microbotryomycetes sp. JL201]|nr:Type 1 phosphatases regulator ypi1 [Microbotryomycetes sp. JL201]